MRKRFIAGATCPKCNDQDSIMLYSENQVEIMECVSCGYRKHQGDDAAEKQASGDLIGVFTPE